MPALINEFDKELEAIYEKFYLIKIKTLRYRKIKKIYKLS